MSQFRAKRLDLGGFINARIIRDHTKRKVYEQFEPERYVFSLSSRPFLLLRPLTSALGYIYMLSFNYRFIDLFLFKKNDRQALRYAIRNTSLPQRVRAQAQLQLAQMHAYTRSTQIKNRCVAGGIARGVFRDFRLARVCFFSSSLLSIRLLVQVCIRGAWAD